MKASSLRRLIVRRAGLIVALALASSGVACIAETGTDAQAGSGATGASSPAIRADVPLVNGQAGGKSAGQAQLTASPSQTPVPSPWEPPDNTSNTGDPSSSQGMPGMGTSSEPVPSPWMLQGSGTVASSQPSDQPQQPKGSSR